MAPRYDLLGIDLDGTLLDPSGRVRPTVAAAIRRARDAGVRTIVCTGRGLVECRGILEAIAQTDPVCVAGGTITADPVTGATLERIPMRPDTVTGAVEVVLDAGHAALVLKDRNEAGFDYLVLTGERNHALDPATVSWFEAMPIEARFASTLHADPFPLGTVRVASVVPLGEQGGLVEAFTARFGSTVTLHTMPVTIGVAAPEGVRGRRVAIIELFDGRASKWTALTGVARRLGLDPSRIAAIGDQANDEAMIAGAACGIAMGNGSEALRAMADRVAPGNDEDGVAYAIDRILDGSW